MSIGILFSTLCRQSLMPLLVMLQVALACAILCNVLFLSWRQLEPMLAPSGVDSNGLILVDHLSAPHRAWSAAEVRAGTEALREVPGVRAVSAAHGLPMSNYLNAVALQGPTGVKVGVNIYEGQGLARTLGVHLLKGRDFLPDEYRDIGSDRGKGSPEPVIITQALARKLFGKTNPVGGILHDPGDKADAGYLVVGVVRHLLRNVIRMTTNGRADNTILMAGRMAETWFLSYAVRVNPLMRQAALHGVSRAIHHQFGALMPVGSEARVEFYSARRDAIFSSRRAALWLLVGMVLTVVVVTGIGIMGLTGFWVQKRRRSIGIRRALGARRVDILLYFQAENALIVGVGIALGMLFAYLGNHLLMRYYELPHLPFWYLPIGAVLLWLLGQLAVLAPALHAAAIPPVAAIRSV